MRERIQRDMIEKEQLQHAADMKLREIVETRAKSLAPPPKLEELRTFQKPDLNPEKLAQLQIEKSRNQGTSLGSGTYLQTEPVYGVKEHRLASKPEAKFQEAMN